MIKLITLAALLAGTLSVHAQLASAINDATANGDGSYTNWFGTFTPENGTLSSEGWLLHEEHGRIYISATGENLWLFDPNLEAAGAGIHGWAYTNRIFFPFFYVNTPVPFLYYVDGVPGPTATPRVFLELASGSKVFLPKVTTDTIVDIAVGNGDFSTLVAAVSTAGLVEALSSAGPFTVLAPTNQAFEDAKTALNLTTEELLALPNLGDILTYHVIPGRILSGDLGLDLGAILKGEYISGYVETLGGIDIRIDTTPLGILINGDTMVSTTDIEGSNGVIHVIDKVLLPPKDIVDTAIDAGFSTLVAAVQAAGLEGALRGDGPFTVFAPTNDAFAALAAALNAEVTDLLALPNLADILTYHVVGAEVYSADVMPGEAVMFNGDPATLSVNSEGGLMINDANIVITDIVTANGVIHVIDAVILPPEA